MIGHFYPFSHLLEGRGFYFYLKKRGFAAWMDVNYEGNRLNDANSTERVCVCVWGGVFEIFSLFKELLDLRRSSTKPAAVVLLNAIQTDCPSRQVGWPSRARENVEVFASLLVAIPRILLLLPHSNKPTIDFAAKTTKLSFHFIICIKIPPSLFQGTTSTASYYYSQKDERAKYRNYSNVLYTVDPIFKELFHQPTLMHNFLYSLTICLLHYYPLHVSSINMLIFRRKKRYQMLCQ